MVSGMDDATGVNGASIAAAFLNHNICSGQNAVAKKFLAQGREIRPLPGLQRQLLWNDSANNFVALTEFHRLAGAPPRLQALGVTKLANVYAGHKAIVPQCVTHCQKFACNSENLGAERSVKITSELTQGNTY